MKNKVRVFILDDNFPKTPELVERQAFNEPISQRDLISLAKLPNWPGEASLKQLTSNLVNHDYVSEGKIEITGFNNPEICLSHLDSNRMPRVVVYDWDYQNHTEKSGSWLLEILQSTPAFVFVYSAIKPAIPTVLNNPVFGNFATRFQLLGKGVSDNSVFTSEDFIFQYILSLVNRDNTILIQGREIRFEANGYLERPSDILHLESILGRTRLLNYMQSHRAVSESSVEEMVSELIGHMLIDRTRGFLITSDFPLLAGNSKLSDKISYVTALREFGLTKFQEAIETGFAKV